MYDPLYDMVNERQHRIRKQIETNRRLVLLRASNPGMWNRVAYRIGGMLISFGTHLRESALTPKASTVAVSPYRITESCR